MTISIGQLYLNLQNNMSMVIEKNPEWFVDTCNGLKLALLHGQQSVDPNLHHCILDFIMMLTDLQPLASRELEGVDNDITA